MQHSVYMEDLDAFTYRRAIADPDTVLLVPVGSVEQHGPHMPLNVDVLLSRAMAGQVAEELGAVVAAPIVYGYKSQQRSGGGNHLAGTTSLDGSTLIDIAKTLTLEFVRHGVKKIAFINGHFENYQFLYEGVDLALRQLAGSGVDGVKALLLSYWDFVDDATIAEIYPEGFPGWDLEHGGVLETSLMLKLFPEKVRMDLVVDAPPAVLPNYDVLPVNPEFTPSSGCLSSAAQATAAKGEILIKHASAAMASALEQEFRSDHR